MKLYLSHYTLITNTLESLLTLTGYNSNLKDKQSYGKMTLLAAYAQTKKVSKKDFDQEAVI